MSDNLKTKTPHRSGTVPTLSVLPKHPSLIWLTGALAFMEGSAFEWTRQDLVDWFTEYLVSPGLMTRPPIAREPDATSISLDPRADCGGNVQELLTRARRRVISALRGIIAPITDDRFLNAALYSTRVQRSDVNGRPVWMPSPRETNCVSDIVLSLFAANILMDREYFQAHLCICKTCDRIFFREAREREDVCHEHSSIAPAAPKDIPQETVQLRAVIRR